MEVTKRFKGLHLIDRVPKELWTEVLDIVQEAGIKTIPKKRNCKRTRWLSEEALQLAVKRREAKGKREKERYTHLNAEFQRIALGMKYPLNESDVWELAPERQEIQQCSPFPGLSQFCFFISYPF